MGPNDDKAKAQSYLIKSLKQADRKREIQEEAQRDYAEFEIREAVRLARRVGVTDERITDVFYETMKEKQVQYA